MKLCLVDTAWLWACLKHYKTTSLSPWQRTLLRYKAFRNAVTRGPKVVPVFPKTAGPTVQRRIHCQQLLSRRQWMIHWTDHWVVSPVTDLTDTSECTHGRVHVVCVYRHVRKHALACVYAWKCGYGCIHWHICIRTSLLEILNSTENYGRRCLTPLSPHRNYILS